MCDDHFPITYFCVTGLGCAGKPADPTHNMQSQEDRGHKRGRVRVTQQKTTPKNKPTFFPRSHCIKHFLPPHPPRFPFAVSLIYYYLVLATIFNAHSPFPPYLVHLTHLKSKFAKKSAGLLYLLSSIQVYNQTTLYLKCASLHITRKLNNIGWTFCHLLFRSIFILSWDPLQSLWTGKRFLIHIIQRT